MAGSAIRKHWATNSGEAPRSCNKNPANYQIHQGPNPVVMKDGSITGDAGILQSLSFALQSICVAEFWPIESIEGDETKAKHGNDKAARHIKSVCHVTHQLWKDCPAHNCHNDEGRGLLGPRTKSKNAEGEYGW